MKRAVAADRDAVPDFAIRRDAARDCWLVRQGKQWRRAREVSVLTPMILLRTGEMRGYGVVDERGDVIVVNP